MFRSNYFAPGMFTPGYFKPKVYVVIVPIARGGGGTWLLSQKDKASDIDEADIVDFVIAFVLSR